MPQEGALLVEDPDVEVGDEHQQPLGDVGPQRPMWWGHEP